LVDDGVVPVGKRVLDELRLPESSPTKNNDHLGVVGFVTATQP
jgi:hypothetical protein